MTAEERERAEEAKSVAPQLDHVWEHQPEWIGAKRSWNDNHVAALTPARRRALEREYVGDRFTVNPRRAWWLPLWDLIMLGAMLFTALITPYEVTFLDDGPCITLLFVVNRIVDLCFFLDLLLLFNLQYQDRNGFWVKSRSKIIRHYLHTWFLVDALSVAPFYLPNLYLSREGIHCDFVTGQYQLASPNVTSGQISDGLARASRGMRIVRLLRMIKLARVFKASRVLKRLLADILMTKLELTFAALRTLQVRASLSLCADPSTR